jgi:hypothetical protein
VRTEPGAEHDDPSRLDLRHRPGLARSSTPSITAMARQRSSTNRHSNAAFRLTASSGTAGALRDDRSRPLRPRAGYCDVRFLTRSRQIITGDTLTLFDRSAGPLLMGDRGKPRQIRDERDDDPAVPGITKPRCSGRCSIRRINHADSRSG